MPRAPRIFVPNGVYHVTQRATAAESLFLDDVDHDAFSRLLDIAVRRARWKLHGHCHMTTHVHLLVQTPEPTLGSGMRFLMSSFVQEFNLRHGRRGTLVEGRYRSKLVETTDHYVACLQYFAMNPVAAGLCATPEEWPWSSYFSIERLLRGEIDATFA